VKRLDPGNSYTLYFFGGMYEDRRNSSNQQTGTTLYYPAGGAMRITGTGAGLFFILSDHLDSTSVVTTAAGAVLSTTGYYPFGETRYSTGTLNTDRLYTGQQSLASLGIYNYKARYYSPSLGRFLSADTVTPQGPQGLNRYAYANNSPIMYNDPTGHLSVFGQWLVSAYRTTWGNIQQASNIVANPNANFGQKTLATSYVTLLVAAHVFAIAGLIIAAPEIIGSNGDTQNEPDIFLTQQTEDQPSDSQPPGDYLAGKSPRQVEPGIKTTSGVHVNDVGREEPWVAHYDDYGRFIGRTDYNAGNEAQGFPDIHYHVYEYSDEYHYGHYIIDHAPGEYPYDPQ
jgi:RHS repeat-associated protein